MNFSYDLRLSRFSSPSAIPSFHGSKLGQFYTEISIFFPPSPPRQKHFPYHRRRSWKIFRVSSRVDGSETILRSTEHRIRGPKGSIGIGERGPYATQSLYPRLMLARWAWAGHRYKSKPRRPSDT